MGHRQQLFSRTVGLIVNNKHVVDVDDKKLIVSFMRALVCCSVCVCILYCNNNAHVCMSVYDSNGVLSDYPYHVIRIGMVDLSIYLSIDSASAIGNRHLWILSISLTCQSQVEYINSLKVIVIYVLIPPKTFLHHLFPVNEEWLPVGSVVLTCKWTIEWGDWGPPVPPGPVKLPTGWTSSMLARSPGFLDLNWTIQKTQIRNCF